MDHSLRRLITVRCADETLVGTLDEARGRVGLLIVSGGNEIRSGAHRGMTLLAARVAAAGFPVFRFDRRGIGDSSGENGGYLSSRDDIRAAAAAFEREANPERIVAFGNCDAATALALFACDLNLTRLVLANPWTVEPIDDLPPPAAIRAHYAAKLTNPREWWRLITGGVNLAKLARGLRRSRQAPAAALADQLALSLAGLPAPATILTARGDATAVAFRAALPHVPVVERDSASHSFAATGDADWLYDQIVTALRAAERDITR